MSSRSPVQSPPDLRPAVRTSAILSMVLLLAAAGTGVFAASGTTWTIVHTGTILFALPVSLVANLLALVASQPPAVSNLSQDRVSNP